MPTQLEPSAEVVDIVHGVKVHDPYRWLEDRDSPETGQWLVDQRGRFDEYFKKLEPLDDLKQRVRAYLDVETIDQIGRVRDHYFYRKRKIGQEQPAIYEMGASDRLENLLVDPTGLGRFASVGIHRISDDGGLLAYELKEGGEHSSAIYLVETTTGRVFPDFLERGLTRGFVFQSSGRGFYYCHDSLEAATNSSTDHQIRFHRFGMTRDDDVTLFRLSRESGSKLMLRSSDDILSAIYYHDLDGIMVVDFYISRQHADGAWRCVRKNVPAPFAPFFHLGRLYTVRMDNRSNGDIVELEPADGHVSRVIVPEWEAPLKSCALTSSRFFVSYLVGTDSIVRVWSIDGDCLGTLPLETGYTWVVMPGYSTEATEVFLQSESFNEPPTLYLHEVETGHRTLWAKRQRIGPSSRAIPQRLPYASKDGTKIALTLLGRPESEDLMGRPIIMTAYGGFGLTLTPRFSAFVSIMVELGFLFVLPEIRGGGERGRPWHEAARGRNRQVAFDDFISAAEWLCEKGITSPQKLGIFGGSNSGLLVGAAITQRPDLFRAALCVAPLLDMVRYHLFDRARVWAQEYGTAEDRDDFRALFAYSPYHHISDGTNYPAIFFICGDKDTRCNSAHTRKMAARLSKRPSQENTILLDHSVERGHKPTMPLTFRIDSLTHRIAFLCHEIGVALPGKDT